MMQSITILISALGCGLLLILQDYSEAQLNNLAINQTQSRSKAMDEVSRWQRRRLEFHSRKLFYTLILYINQN